MKGLNLFRKDTRSRIAALALAAVMALSGIPSIPAQAEGSNTTVVATVADLETLHRPIDIYGQNTLNGGKITVGKSVSTEGFKENLLDGVSTGGLAPADNNFLVTLSQSAQAVGLASKMPVPVDAVFVLDTSGSMAKPENDPRYINMISAANEAIASLLAANDQNRIAVVAFSSEDYGRGTSDDAAANVLSDLAHYDGAAATAHLQRVNEYGQTNSSGTFVAGRSTVTNATIEVQWGNSTTNRSYSGNAFRKAQEGGTNIQAGIALGAEILMNVAAADTKVLIEGEQVTRMPFIIVLSDGAPTFSSTAADWYDADAIADADEQGPGSAPYAGNGFLAAMTAAYYKGKITEYYYGDNASEDNRCNIYTVGVDVNTASDMTASEVALAEMTLNPAQRFTNSNSWYNSFSSYWSSYNAATVRAFNINVGESYQDGWETKYRNKNFQITADSITNSRNYVNGKNKDGVSMYAGGMGYNDEYFATSGSSEALNNTFKELVRLIQIKAISLPTDTTVSADFGGYVHFYDPIGEYMEVKDVHGIVADGYFFRGASFAKNMVNYGTGANDAFDAAITEALNGRLELSESGKLDEADIKAIVDAAVQADGQLYYKDNSDYENSFCWWGNSYTNSTTGDEHVQFLGFAEDDSIEYIENAIATGNVIPTAADYVCRSSYYYGTAGGTIEPIDDFLLMVIRVQRSLVAPYQETVYVSIPGSLLSVDRVLITEDHTQNPVTYESFVQAENPVRIIYEVGLQSDINAQNVAQKLAGSAYVAEDTLDDSQGSKDNYEAEENTYYFYTNDWDRTKSVSSHERALAHAGFDVAEDNDFYAFLEDTLLYTDTNGTPATSMTTAETYYYKRPYYAWNDNGAKNEEKTLFACTLEEEYIAVVAPSQDVISKFAAQDASGQWYVKAGTYTAYSLSAENDDTIKVDANDNPANYTGTSTIVAHPMRTNAEHDSHYTVFLGNNGRLALKADKTKDVTITRLDDASNSGAVITDADGKLITVDDVLTYTIKVVNNEGAAANAVVTDSVPYGTELVEGSISFDANGTGATASNSNSNGAITWNIQNIPVNGTVYVSFQTKVTTAALDQNAITVDNQATVQIGNNPAYTTNKVENPPYGKLAQGTDGTVNPETLKVGDELIYRINYYNNEDTVATITVTDIIPAGTTYMEGSATHSSNISENEKFAISTTNEKTALTWTLKVQPNTSGYVSFKVKVNENAKTPVENGATITIGENIYATNTTSADVLTGDLKLTKEVTGAGGDINKEFTLVLTSMGAENDGYLGISGEFDATRYDNSATNGTAMKVTFTDGVAEVTIKHDEKVIIHGLPANLSLNVAERTAAGYTPTYDGGQTVVIEAGKVNDAAVGTDVVNTYVATPYEFQLKGTKVLDTDEHFDSTPFYFEVYKYGTDWSGTGNLATTANTIVSSDSKTAVFEFAPRTFTVNDVGEHYYIIKEKSGTISGVTYDNTIYRMKLDVANDGVGAISLVSTIYKYNQVTNNWDVIAITGDSSASNDITNTTVTFTNEYDTVSIQLTGTKNLNNLNLSNAQFGFEVIEGTTIVATGQNDANGNIVFRPITYHGEGVHTYTIKEIDGKIPNMSYDTTQYEVVVTVAEDTSTGKLVADVTSIKNKTTNSTANSIVFENTYVPEGTSVVLEGTKVLSNQSGDVSRVLKDKEFSFEVLDSNNNVVSTGHNDSSGKISFTNIPIAYDANADYQNGVTYEYKVKEVVPTGGAKDPYMKYDTSEKTIQVKVTVDKATGDLNAELLTATTDVVFTNIQYPDSISVTPVGTKTTSVYNNSEANPPADATFSFSVINVSTGNTVYTGIAGSSKDGADIQFSSMNYTREGEYDYWIVENNAGASGNGITYDTTRYRMHVSITLTDGQLANTVTYYRADVGNENSTSIDDYNTPLGANELPSFNNTYDAKGYLNVTAKKNLEGRALKAGEFTFKLQRLNADGTLEGSEVEGISDADGNIQFATLYYSSADLNSSTSTIKYMMSENIPTINKIPGVTYDLSEYVIEVGLSDNSSGDILANILSVTRVKNASGASVSESVETATFTNKYQAVTGTSATINANKKLTGRSLKEGEFIFDLYYVDGNTTTLVDTATNSDDGNGSFTKVSFTRNYLPAAVDFADNETEKTYTYKICEQVGNVSGVTYSDDVYWVTVTIKDNGNGSLVRAAVKYYYDNNGTKGEEITDTSNVKFSNSYKAKGTTFTPNVIKVLNGRSMVDNEFSFEVKDITPNSATSGSVVSGGLSKTAADGANANVVFTAIGYDEAGTYTYEITEVKGQLAGVKYATNTIYLRVTVIDDGSGQLKASGNYYADATCGDEFLLVSENVKFVNTYTAERITVPVKATKVLKGRDLADREFDFVLKDDANNVVAYGDNVDTDNNSENPDEVIFMLNYSQSDVPAGTTKNFVYYMSEVEPITGHAGGVTTDNTIYTVVVKVTNNTTTGKLDYVVGYYTEYSDDGNDGNDKGLTDNEVPAFENTYTTTPAEISVNAQKFLSGKQLEAEEFEFVITEIDASGSTVGTPSNVENDASGIVKLFDKKQFTKAGTYYYKVKEGANATQLKNDDDKVIGIYSNDPTEYIIKVDVVDDLLGKLHATTTYYKVNAGSAGNTEVAGISFTNTYTPASLVSDLSTSINAIKTVTSPNGYTLEAGEFQFVVKDVTGNTVATGENEADGKIKFTDFTFTQPGEYRYWISEVVNTTKEAYMTYDARSWEVHVTVSYAYDDILVENSSEVLYPAGTLYIADGAVKTYASSRALETEAPAFVNIYTPAPVSLTITADKKLTVPEGSERKLQAHEFTFRVKDEHGIIRAESHNDTEGNITFNFTETVSGKHTYTVVEYVPAVNANGIYYDKETKATIEVTVVDDGSGQLKIENAASITKENVAVFTNTYNPTAATTTISAKKVLHGAELTAGAFKFELVDRTLNKVVETVTNDADGMITFTQTFDKIGQYPFLIREVKGTDANVTYDTTEYALMVDVKDNLVGQLVATVDFQREAVFENTFTPPVEPTPEPEDDGRIYKSFAFVKVWNDNNNKLGKRPDSITVELYQDGVYVTDVILSKENGWTDTVILMYANGDHVYEWTMKEKNVPAGYVATYKQSEYTVINTLKELSTVTNGSGTGDDSNLGFFLGISAVCLIAIIGLVVLMKFRKKDEE